MLAPIPMRMSLVTSAILSSHLCTLAQIVQTRSEPRQLMYAGGSPLDPVEERYADRLVNGNPEERLEAADRLWRLHSLKYAEDVLAFLADSKRGDERFSKLKEYIDGTMKPKEIIWHLKK